MAPHPRCPVDPSRLRPHHQLERVPSNPTPRIQGIVLTSGARPLRTRDRQSLSSLSTQDQSMGTIESFSESRRKVAKKTQAPVESESVGACEVTRWESESRAAYQRRTRTVTARVKLLQVSARRVEQVSARRVEQVSARRVEQVSARRVEQVSARRINVSSDAFERPTHRTPAPTVVELCESPRKDSTAIRMRSRRAILRTDHASETSSRTPIARVQARLGKHQLVKVARSMDRHRPLTRIGNC